MDVYKSNMTTIVAKIKGLFSEESKNKLLLECAVGIRASNMRRIHNDGLNVSLNSIGNYSTTPIYINPKNSPRKFTGQGKNGEIKFQNGISHKTKYFDNGYKGFRNYIGRTSNKVNLQLSGNLKANYQIQKTTNGYNIGFLSNKYTLISKGLEEHFNTKIWGVSQRDRKIVNIILKKFTKNA